MSESLSSFFSDVSNITPNIDDVEPVSSNDGETTLSGFFGELSNPVEQPTPTVDTPSTKPYFELAQQLSAPIIIQESSNDPNAVSHKGAVGLMQLMPDTAREVARSLGDEFSVDKLKDPYWNTRWGIEYVRQGLENYDGDPRFALARYHAGPKVDNDYRYFKETGVYEIPKTNNYFDGFKFTKDYVDEVLEKAERGGNFDINSIQKPQPENVLSFDITSIADELKAQSNQPEDEEHSNIFSRLGKSWGRATAGLVGGTGGLARMTQIPGIKDIGENLTDYSKDMYQFYEEKNPGVIDKAAEAISTGIQYLVPGMGVARGSMLIGALVSSPKVAAALGLSLSALSEAGIEAGSVYNNLVDEKKMDESEALKRSLGVLSANIALNLATNKFSGLFESGEQISKEASKSFVEGIKKRVKEIPKAAIGEGIQEGVQGKISAVGSEDEYSLGNFFEDAIYGGLAGGVMSGVSIASDVREGMRQQNNNQETTTQTTEEQTTDQSTDTQQSTVEEDGDLEITTTPIQPTETPVEANVEPVSTKVSENTQEAAEGAENASEGISTEFVQADEAARDINRRVQYYEREQKERQKQPTTSKRERRASVEAGMYDNDIINTADEAFNIDLKKEFGENAPTKKQVTDRFSHIPRQIAGQLIKEQYGDVVKESTDRTDPASRVGNSTVVVSSDVSALIEPNKTKFIIEDGSNREVELGDLSLTENQKKKLNGLIQSYKRANSDSRKDKLRTRIAEFVKNDVIDYFNKNPQKEVSLTDKRGQQIADKYGVEYRGVWDSGIPGKEGYLIFHDPVSGNSPIANTEAQLVENINRARRERGIDQLIGEDVTIEAQDQLAADGGIPDNVTQQNTQTDQMLGNKKSMDRLKKALNDKKISDKAYNRTVSMLDQGYTLDNIAGGKIKLSNDVQNVEIKDKSYKKPRKSVKDIVEDENTEMRKRLYDLATSRAKMEQAKTVEDAKSNAVKAIDNAFMLPKETKKSYKGQLEKLLSEAKENNTNDKNFAKALNLIDKISKYAKVHNVKNVVNNKTKANPKPIREETRNQYNQLSDQFQLYEDIDRMIDRGLVRKPFKKGTTEDTQPQPRYQRLLDAGMIRVVEKDGQKYYKPTDKGRKFHKEFNFDEKMNQLMDKGQQMIDQIAAQKAYNRKHNKETEEKHKGFVGRIAKQLTKYKNQVNDEGSFSRTTFFKVQSTLKNLRYGAIGPYHLLQRMDGFAQDKLGFSTGAFTDSFGKLFRDADTKKYTVAQRLDPVTKDAMKKHGITAEDLVKYSPEFLRQVPILGDLPLIKHAVNKSKKETFTIPSRNGNKKMAKGHVIGIYLHTLHPDNLNHLMGGGLTHPVTGRNIKFNQQDIETIKNMVESDKKAMSMVNMFDELFQETGKILDEISMEFNGHPISIDGRYFPILVANSKENNLANKYIKGDLTVDDLNDFMKVTAPGNTKQRTDGADGSIYLESPFEAFARTSSLLGRYAQLETTQELRTLYGQVKPMLAEKGLKAESDMIGKQLNELEGRIRRGKDENILRAIYNNYSKAALGLNLRVSFFQPVSVFNAIPYLANPKVLSKAGIPGFKNRKANIEWLMENSPFFHHRQSGNMSADIADHNRSSAEARKWFQKEAMGITSNISAADAVAASIIYEAVKADAKLIGLEGKKADDYIVQKTEQIFIESQPTSDSLYRPALQKSILLRPLVMFGTQRLKNWQMMDRGFAMMRKGMKSGDKAMAMNGFSYLFTPFIIESMIVAGIKFGYNAWVLGRDDEEIDLTMYETVLSNIPVAGNIVNLGWQVQKYGRAFESSDPYTTMLGIAPRIFNALNAKNEKTRTKKFKEIAEELAMLSGTPIYGFEQIVELVNRFAGED